MKPADMFANSVAVGIAKARTKWSHVLVLSFQAGVYLSIAFVATLYAIAGLTDFPPAIGRLLGALIFPFGLLLIAVAGGDLLTGNFLFLSTAVLARRVTPRNACVNWGIVALGNLLGCLFIAFLFGLGGEHFTAGGEPLAVVLRVAREKIDRRFTTNLIRGIGCNILVGAACYCAAAAETAAGKAAAIWPLITTMVFISQEHIVVDFFAEPLGLVCGLDASVVDVVFRSWLPVTMGNFIGAQVLAIPYWYVYSENDTAASALLYADLDSKKNADTPGLPVHQAGRTGNSHKESVSTGAAEWNAAETG